MAVDIDRSRIAFAGTCKVETKKPKIPYYSGFGLSF